MKNPATVANAERTLLDTDGENRALRSFLMQYGVPGLTVAAMGRHMRRSGWESNYWPDFARQVDTAAEHLTKAGAQIWIRHLLSMEPRAATPAGADVAASVLLKLCDQLDAMKRRLRSIPGEGQRESYYVADDVNCYVEEARAALAGAPAEVKPVSVEVSYDCMSKITTSRYKLCTCTTPVGADVASISGLPPLPNSLEEVRAMFRGEFDYARPGNDYYSAAQMWAYGRACIAAAPVGADVAADIPHLPRAVGYRHTMDNTEGLKGNKPSIVFSATKPNPFGKPGLDYSASYPVRTEAIFTADQMKEHARAARAALAGAPAETVKPATFAPGTIVRKKSGSQWQGAIVGTYSTALTPEGYAVESSTHRGSVQIYPVGALELVTKGNV